MALHTRQRDPQVRQRAKLVGKRIRGVGRVDGWSGGRKHSSTSATRGSSAPYRLTQRDRAIRDNQNMGAYSPALLPAPPCPQLKQHVVFKIKMGTLPITEGTAVHCLKWLTSISYFVFPVTSWIGLISIIIIIPVLGMEKKKKGSSTQLVTAITVGS